MVEQDALQLPASLVARVRARVELELEANRQQRARDGKPPLVVTHEEAERHLRMLDLPPLPAAMAAQIAKRAVREVARMRAEEVERMRDVRARQGSIDRTKESKTAEQLAKRREILAPRRGFLRKWPDIQGVIRCGREIIWTCDHAHGAQALALECADDELAKRGFKARRRTPAANFEEGDDY